MEKTFAMISLGCAKNLVNSEQMLYLMSEAGFSLVPEAEGADLAIVNTCGFIDAAKTEAIDNILELAELKKQGKLGGLIVTGCLAERYKDSILSEMPEIDAVLGVGNFKDIVAAANTVMEGRNLSLFGSNSAPVDEIPRVVSTGPAWAYLRIAEGCNNFCAFCAIPYIRGRYRSRSMENILEEANDLAAHGVKELIVIAQDITRYGTDLYGKRSLAALCRELAKIEGVEWIRLHYLYPDQFDDELIDEIASNDKIVKYLDIPIQHINDGILKAMNRRGTGGEIRSLFKTLRERIPGLVLRTSLISGLPGEGEAEFEELCEFLKEARIERVGVFPFSPEEGTPAASMPHVDESEAQRRADLIMELQAPIMDDYCNSFLGKTIRVLYEYYDEESGYHVGRSYADSPDIDGLVLFSGDCAEGDMVDVLITDTDEGLLIGEQV
ncbi:MAG: 30S ribosomal protein S12 methylthiotransferase RimO [Candidatus Limivicinus sp.]|nr:30S ribosomal protein S12 methylthiotransferase RimO [Clostridiales bacterium]MDY6132417.1 30S ribosomal protein S12 methylthiotransferase RimO [Candidatus Limivicinus sp.]